MSLVCFLVAIVLFLTPFGGRAYGRVVLGLSYYLLWPFGQYVERELSPGDLRTDFGALHEGDESRPLLSRSVSILERERKAERRRRIISTIKNLPRHICHLKLGGIVYYILYYLLIGKAISRSSVVHSFVQSISADTDDSQRA